MTALAQRPLALALNLTRTLLIGAFAITLIAALHPELRSKTRAAFLSDYRMIVSTARGDLIGNGGELVVAKVKTRDSLLLEIYEALSDGSQRLIERIEMADQRDGFFNFNGQAVNLAIDDIDGDGKPEILVPTFDANLVGRLSIYHYSAVAQGFQRLLR